MDAYWLFCAHCAALCQKYFGPSKKGLVEMDDSYVAKRGCPLSSPSSHWAFATDGRETRDD
eukprot:scaffold7196_cov78-Skeletonema_dohrnii-CCMP3373.AAC.3